MTHTGREGMPGGFWSVRVLLAAASCTLALLVLPLRAQGQSADDGFDPDADNSVLAVAVQSDGKVLAGGTFTQLGGQARAKLGRLLPDGAVDGTFTPGADDTVRALAVQPDQQILVGGDFTTLAGQARVRLARLRIDGSLDPSFTAGADGTVYALAIQPDGKILVGGSFTTLGGQTRNNIARLNPDGSLDTGFNPNANGSVRALALQGDGKIVIGGFFTMLGGLPRTYVARLNPDGSLDTSFDPGANNAVYSVAIQPDHQILIGGLFTMVAGQSRSLIARLRPDGSVDPNFDPGANVTVRALVVRPDGQILVGGLFTSLGGQARNRIGQLHPDGSLDTTFDPDAGNSVLALAGQPDGKIVVGGTFTTLAGQARTRIARLYPDGRLDTTMTSDTGAVLPGSSPVRALAVQPDGKIVIGGDFTSLGGLARRGIARVHPDGSLDTSFDPAQQQANVYALAVESDGQIVVGGSFSELGGQPRNRIARLEPNGSLDAFNPDADSFVYAVAVQPDGKIVIGGSFTMLGGSSRNYVARLNSDGSLDSGFDPNANGTVQAVAVQPDGKVLIAGSFTMVKGLARSNIARLHPDGSVDQGFNPSADGTVWALVVQPDGRIVVGGQFGQLNGQQRTRIGRLQPDGVLDTGFAPGITNDTVFALALHSDRRILVGGAFTMLGGQVRNRTGRLAMDGSLDSSFDPNANATVRTFAVQVDGKVLVGGEFTTVGGETRSGVARLATATSAVQSLEVMGDGAGVHWARSGSGPELDFVTFASSTDGVAYSPLGSGTWNPLGWDLTGLTLPSGALYLRARGSDQRGSSESEHESIQRIFRDTTTTTLTSSANPSVTGQPVTFTATVTPSEPALGPPTGSVTVTEGATVLAVGLPLNGSGQASFVTGALTAGAGHLLTATYSGDATHAGSVGGLAQTVNKAASVTTIVSHTPDPSAVGQPVTVAYSVSAVPPGMGSPGGGGRVAVSSSDAGVGCQDTVSAGGCTLTFTSPGAKTLTAAYLGGADFTFSVSAAVPHAVTTVLTVTIDGHPNGDSFTSTSPFLDLSGTAGTSARLADTPAATVTGVTWENDRGGSGPAEGTTTWRAPLIPLQPGANIVTIRATDDTGNTAAVSVTVTVSQLLYYLAEGATGPFFDLDLLLGNPNAVDAPVSITFLKEDGSTVLFGDTLTANSQRTISVNSIPGLETAAVSTVVSSDSGLPLAVERSMLWDASVPAPRTGDGPVIAPGATHYGGHTAKAVDSPRMRWLFAEGSQGFFDTYLLLANANATPANVTVTYLVEGGAPVVQNVVVGATARLTLFAGAVAQLVGTSFGIVVDASQPIIAERAMYFSAGRFWEGGHESAGVPEASTRWFHAEGATGTFFDTYILVSNSNGVPANLAVTYLLASGAAIPRNYVVPANGRITINVETQDPQLADAAVSTTVTADVPVISERAMYWVGGFTTWYEAHNSFGVTATGTKWGLAEGRVGTSTGYQTFILLANPAATAAQVRITYLRTNGTTVVKTYTVPPTSRFNVWVNAEVSELVDERFGALIEVTNGVEIAVERALYWDDGGQIWGGGTNATAVRLP